MILTLLTALLACHEAPSEVSIAPPPSPAAPIAAPEPQRWVHASRLHLRDGPLADAPSKGTLDINSPLALVEQRDDFARVRAGNGAEGWVAASFLGEAPLTLAQALAQATAPGAPEQQLSWAQRAAAIAPDDREALRVLGAAYLALGDEARAAQVSRRLDWPEALYLISAGGPARHPQRVRFELATTDRACALQGEPATPEELADLGVTLGETWTVLPKRHAAVDATLEAVTCAAASECSGVGVLLAELEVTLPAGASPILATPERPPRSWREPSPQEPPGEREAITEAMRAWAKANQMTHARPQLSWLGPAWSLSLLATDDPEPAPRHVRFAWREGALTVLSDELTDAYWQDDSAPILLRDLDGDGVLDTLKGDFPCGYWVEHVEGGALMSTAITCCGC